MGHALAKSSKMEENCNLTGMYENLESLREEVANRAGVAELKDSKIAEILNLMNEALQALADTLRTQGEMLAALIKNGEKLKQIVSIIRKVSIIRNLPPVHGDTKIEQRDHRGDEAKWKEFKVCYRCRKLGHIRRDCRNL